ncbi:polysaccharide biosynthesis protein [Macrococcus sp. DPC7161]|uniref:putative polysaccharide biosynthesis protein n=1 Tax=Macrococcus sp. DPC7161 TaxID=2507060 RepID=UPI00100BD0DF|nr:polysaccharide biosynthesis protein [Macrococcus sp. DPC7161]RXK18294.1 polysaccharide biosynthesis protein [Macrococcus sp. DPC7161]
MSETKDTLVRSTFILTASIFITKILGILYIIPFYAIIGGEENLSPYNMAYPPYVVMLTIAGAGVPLAVAKYVAKYNALGAYKISHKLYRSSLVVMGISGLLGFIVLYFLSPSIASATLASPKAGELGEWTVPQITEIIRVLSFAVIFIPFLATFRGIFQGYDSMGPTAVSTVIEQVARIAFLLGGTFLVLKVIDPKKVLLANEIATFAAAVGAIAAILTLAYYWRKRKPHIDKMVESDETGMDVSYRSMYKEILLYSIPFVIVSLCIPLFSTIDQFTHNKGLDIAGVAVSKHNMLLTILNTTTNKLVMIPTSLAAGFAISLVPSIARTYARKETKLMHHQIKQTFGVLLFLTVPASLGIMVLATPLYTVFYSYNAEASQILFFYAPVSILIALLSVTAAILQGIDKQSLTVWIVIGALFIKAIINLPLIIVFHTNGAVLGTAIALLFAIICNMLVIKKYAGFQYRQTLRHILYITLYSLLMLVSVEIVYALMSFFLNSGRKLDALIIVMVSAFVGGLVYAALSMKSRLADEFLGDRVQSIRNKLVR